MALVRISKKIEKFNLNHESINLSDLNFENSRHLKILIKSHRNYYVMLLKYEGFIRKNFVDPDGYFSVSLYPCFDISPTKNSLNKAYESSEIVDLSCVAMNTTIDREFIDKAKEIRKAQMYMEYYSKYFNVRELLRLNHNIWRDINYAFSINGNCFTFARKERTYYYFVDFTFEELLKWQKHLNFATIHLLFHSISEIKGVKRENTLGGNCNYEKVRNDMKKLNIINEDEILEYIENLIKSQNKG